ncbi:MAG: DEAD/DEAH box helicase [Desulfobacterota bacterium]|nr:DEAD/DEAH box helicase [Thermodesulfobacteriota bacterium]
MRRERCEDPELTAGGSEGARRSLGRETSGLSIEEVLQTWKRTKGISSCITALRVFEKREGEYRPVPDFLHPLLREALKSKGIATLYSHQAEALRSIQEGRDVVIVTPTASGKTLCYNLPVLNQKLSDPSTKAFYLFPTKALSQDQRVELQDLIERVGRPIRAFTYDGDTPAEARQAIRSQGDVVITNPDMLHTGILPHHTKWASFFQGLRFVVIDELHTYRGVFGSHMTNVLRRLKRICEFYGASPQFICCSATIANPKDLAERLLERPTVLIDRNGAPSSEKIFLFYNPPLVNKELGIRGNPLHAARRLATPFLQKGIQTILFATSRLQVEVLTKYLKDRFEKEIGDRGKVRGYRGGYLPEVRREIERGLREGAVKAVVSTNALELGIDIGDLDVCLIVGYPGTIASTYQQAGRVGRRGERSLVVLIARSLPLDQFIVENPDYFFGRSPEYGLINPDNLLILLSHLQCAAFELPFREGERFGKEDLKEMLQFLEEKGILHQANRHWYWAREAYPAEKVSLRSSSEENFVVVDTTKKKEEVIAEVDFVAAHTTLYEGAVYLCESEIYSVERLDYPNRRAYVKKAEGDYYTEAIDYTDVAILEGFAARQGEGIVYEHGEVRVLTRLVGYKKIKFYTLENLGYGKIELPDLQFHTAAYWMTFRKEWLDRLPYSRLELIEGVLGLSYALHSVASLHLMCDPHDLNRCVGDRGARWFLRLSRDAQGWYSFCEPEEVSKETLGPFEPTLFLYENYPGGIGFSPQLFDDTPVLLEKAERLISKCDCAHGCPSCVGPVKEVGEKSKRVAQALLKEILRLGVQRG